MIEDRNLKPGTVLVARYKKRDHRCEVVKGAEGKVAFRVGGKEYGSPSAAGSAVMDGTACNGWRFWTVEGQETRKAATKATATPRKPKGAAKPKGKAKRSAKAKPARRIEGSSNGEQPTAEKKPVGCGECGQEFPTSREAAGHMRDEHGSAEAAGSGGG